MLYNRVSFNNWGVYYKLKEFYFDVEPGSNRVIIPVGGRSGEGKTTLLNGVKTAWFGPQADCVKRGAYKQYINSMLNNKSKNEGDFNSYIELELSVPNHEDETDTIIIRREWDLSEPKEFGETLTVTINGKAPPDFEDNQDKNIFLQTLMPLETSQFFLFDGEKVQLVANDDTFDKQIENAMMDTLNISNYVHLAESLDKFIKKKEKELDKSVAHSQLAKLSSDIYRLNEESESITRQLRNKDIEFTNLNVEIKKLNSWLMNKGLASNFQRPMLLRNLESMEVRKRELRNRIIEYMSGSLANIIMEPLLVDIKDQLVKEKCYIEEMTLGEQTEAIFDELVAQLEHEEVDPPLSSYQKKVIKQLQRKVWETTMSPNSVEEVPLIHNDAISHIEMERFERDLEEAISSAYSGLSSSEEISEEYRTLLIEIDKIQTQLMSLPKDSEVHSTQDELAKLEEQYNELKADMKMMTLQLEQLKVQRDSLIIQRNEMKKKLDSKNKLLKKIEKAESVRDVLLHFVTVLKKRKTEDVEKYLTEMFKKLHRKKDYARNFKFDPVTLKVTFDNDLDQEIHKNNLSQSEKQIYAVSFLWALQKASKRQYPVIIDTPLGRLDAEHKHNMLEHYFPYAGPQVIILSTEEEISVSRKGMIKPFIAREYRLEISPEDHHEVQVVDGYFR
ncbi:DNA sulfur modification protein DndD [Bacillus sp. V3B]|uniref:DNA sulfur modification protein DndD n=1 Tax=Bacillus sp. V3B TaxID=2804915 RepID=UPI00210BA8F1|nr:DNA sulfur modification protein DndD [Bacillus sp. V3B]MCQ6277051.1 DNA sulfur modification protein DndD [Bacillus sp. V3B]